MKLTKRGYRLVSVMVTIAFIMVLGYAGHIETLGH